jgi:predicted metal-binding membrane protein
MTFDTQDTSGIRNGILIASAASWAVLLAMPTNLHALGHGPSSFRMILAMGLPTALAKDWLLMAVAMMSPVLFLPLCHVRLRSFAHRRWRASALFVVSYFGVWMVVGSVLLAGELGCKLFISQAYAPAAAVLLIALVWQCSPVKQRCLNRCHSHTELSAHGVAADLDAFRFGATHGLWCSGSCWALMLLPMLLPGEHIAVTAIVTALIFSERLERPRAPDWRWRGFGKLARIVVAQARIRLRGLRPIYP